jgi:hypothetical protein
MQHPCAVIRVSDVDVVTHCVNSHVVLHASLAGAGTKATLGRVPGLLDRRILQDQNTKMILN